MREIRKILVPTDFSAHADIAAEFAVGLAQKFGAEICFLHVYDIPTYVLPDGAILPAPDVVGNLISDVEDNLERVRARYAAEGVRVSVEMRQGVPLPQIVKFAQDYESDLIVMGTHGRTGIEHFLIGSVAEKVVRKAPCPVLTVRRPGFEFKHPSEG
jgi:nucleotide-binding universal stress UspA family protein